MKRKSISSKNDAESPKRKPQDQKEDPNNCRNTQCGFGEVKKELKATTWTEKHVFYGCMGFRILNALLIQTYFNPDEHWQALEVAHRVVFGYGHLTWEWEKGIRSFFHPMVFAILYKILAIFKLDTPWSMIKAPRLLQSIFAAIGDLYLYKLARRFFGERVSQLRVIVLIGTCLLDRWMYGSWVLVPLNFLKFNFFSSGGDYYGTHPWHWYFTQGFPAMVFTFLPLSAVGIWLSKEWKLAGLIGWVLGLYSVLGHKEFRFVLPVLPITLMFAGYSLAEMERHSSRRILRKLDETKSNGLSWQKWSSWKYFSIFVLLITNIPAALYTSLVHQRGSEAVMGFLAREAEKGEVQSVTFLMPCHATPYYASVHRNLPMYFLDCSPSDSSSESNSAGVIDESDRFMIDPVGFVSNMFNNSRLSSHMVLFDSQEVQLKEFLASHGYRQARRFFHAHFPVDRELQGYVVVYVWQLPVQIQI